MKRRIRTETLFLSSLLASVAIATSCDQSAYASIDADSIPTQNEEIEHNLRRNASNGALERNVDRFQLERLLECVRTAELADIPNRNSEIAVCVDTFLENDPCVTSGFHDANCRWANFKPGTPTFHEASTNEVQSAGKVLVIDEFAPSSLFPRYQRQVRGSFGIKSEYTIEENRRSGELEVEADARVVPTDLDAALPVRLGAVLEVLSDLRSHTKSSDLTELLEPLLEKYEQALPDGTAHGNTVLKVLLDLIPQKQVLMLNMNDLKLIERHKEPFCHFENPAQSEEVRRAALRASRELGKATAKAISQFMSKGQQDVQYINASFGFTGTSIARSFERTCGRSITRSETEEIFRIYHPMMVALFNAPGTFAFQAANERPGVGIESTFDKANSEYGSRIRVGTLLDVPDNEMTGKGQSFEPLGRKSPYFQWWADVYVNSGCGWLKCRENNPLSITHELGLGRFPFPAPATSFVTPVALSEAVRLFRKYTLEGDGPESVRARILDEFKDRPYRDPLKTRKPAFEHNTY